MVAPGGCAWLLWGGHVWLLRGGLSGCSAGVCGCSWGEGGSVCGIRRDTEIRSMSGRYASYWNAFLLFNNNTGRIYPRHPCTRLPGDTFLTFSCLPPATKLRQGNVFTLVCHSVHGQGVAYTTPGADTPPTEQMHPRGADIPPRSRPPPAQCMLRDTGNKRAIRILLECILVFFSTFCTQRQP